MEDREEIYREVFRKLEGLRDPSLSNATNICNILATLKYDLNLFWVGIYTRQGDKLYLGPYQGMPACTRIDFGKGVCGTVASTGKVAIVEDVTVLKNYIACHPETMSEIVIPGYNGDEVTFVLDVDSTQKDYFSNIDKRNLVKVASLLSEFVA